MDPAHLGLPSEDRLACSTGLVDNHEYRDLRDLSWEEFDAVFEEEPELLARLEAGEDLYDDTFAYETLVLGLEPGVASTVVALAALGCPPMTSCAGGPGHREEHPLVVFWCPEEKLEVVAHAAKNAGATVEGHLHPGLMVFAEAGRLDLMRAFAARLSELRQQR